MKRLIFLFIVLTPLLSKGQEIDFGQEYLKAKAFFKEERYGLAKDTFKPLIQASEDNPYSAYSSYYFALCNYHQGFPHLAQDMFLQIAQIYSDWEKIDEVYLWLSYLYTEKQDFIKAYSWIDKLDKNFDQGVKEKYKYYLVRQINSLEIMEELHRNFPEEKLIAERYAETILAQSIITQDREKLEELIELFQLDPVKYRVIPSKERIIKDTYHVAVILPFLVEKLATDTRPKVNQFVFDLYRGIQMAADSLNNIGLGRLIELHVFDSKRDSSVTVGIVNNPIMKEMDLIIGPLFPKPCGVVSQFSYENQINMIHPLSSNKEYSDTNPYFFIPGASGYDMAMELSNYIVSSHKNKKGIIFYGTDEEDKLKADTVKKILEAESFKVVHFREVGVENTKDILRVINGQTVINKLDLDRLAIRPDSIGFIYVASNKGPVYSSVISAVSGRPDSIVIFGNINWYESGVLDVEAFNRLPIALNSSQFINPGSPEMKVFGKKFLLKFNEVPNKYSAAGFEVMYLMGDLMANHGKYFQNSEQFTSFIPGILGYGFNFKGGNRNHLVPILYLDNNYFKVLNMPVDQDNEKR
ncbi:MAG: ABC transporter substrate-binding protein [Cyclobacteriaceae bacterium]|nr:ABC transporter substrate-binding protein [Cyclobacteriaceae bacterium]